jgi:hypothetical protein
MFSDERAAATSEATGDLTWSAAQARCGMDGGHLVRIDSAEEHEYIQTIPWYASGWIGLSEAGKVGRWYWADATGAEMDNAVLRDKNVYAAWGSDQPDGDGDCGEVYYSGIWNGLSCSSDRAFMCARARRSIDRIDPARRLVSLRHSYRSSFRVVQP